MRFHLVYVLCWLAALLGGCAESYRVQSIIDTSEPWASIRRTPDSPLKTNADNYRVFMNPYTYAPHLVDSRGLVNRGSDDAAQRWTFYEIAAGVTEDNSATAHSEKRTAARNMLQNAMLRASDEMVLIHLTAVRATEGTSNFVLGSITTGLAGTAAVVAPPIAAPLAAGAATTNSVRALSNEQYFRNLVTENVYTAIHTRRAKFREIIVKKQRSKIFDYDVEAAIADATYYHEMGSFLFGLSVVRSDIEMANADRVRALLDAQDKELDRSKIPPQRSLQLRLSIE
ncbi:MAG: hypothetical protein K2X32_08975 [Phycisphaerales bacterium]|nr:hypothetical protein [Phycisphaerales bacterium]